MIEVRIIFKSIEEAIVGLAKLQGGAAAKAAKNVGGAQANAGQPGSQVQGAGAPFDSAPRPGAEAPSPAPDKTARKPRADKGQKREPYGPRDTSEDTRALTPEEKKAVEDARINKADDEARAKMQAERDAAAPEIVTFAVAPLKGSATTVASEEDAQKALEAIYKAKGLPAAQAVMEKFGVVRLRDLPKERRFEFIEKATEAAK